MNSTPPRPTMTAEDRQKMRKRHASPLGLAIADRLRAAHHPLTAIESRPDAFWRPSPPGALPYPDGTDDEASAPIPPDASRTFRPVFMARRVSYWPMIIATVIGFVVCAGLIGWFVSAALKGHA